MNNKRTSVVIVDDDPYMRGVLRLLLRSDEYEVVGEAAHGEAALELCIRLRPAVVLLDINMPNKDGLEVLDELKTAKYAGKVVLISGEATLDKVKLAVQKGAAGFIVKPFNSGTVLDELRICLQKAG
jgi:two-component system chemotaxis response regulator CheY